MISSHTKRVVKSIIGTGPTKALANALNGVGPHGAGANDNIKRLQEKSVNDRCNTPQLLSRGIRLDLDMENRRELEVSSPQGTLLRLKAAAQPTCRWTALHIVLGQLNLTDADYVGVVVKSQSHSGSTISRICLRSGTENKFRDCFFSKHLVSTAAPGTHVDILDLRGAKNLPLTSEWRDLVVFFSERDIDLTLTKIRFFSA